MKPKAAALHHAPSCSWLSNTKRCFNMLQLTVSGRAWLAPAPKALQEWNCSTRQIFHKLDHLKQGWISKKLVEITMKSHMWFLSFHCGTMVCFSRRFWNCQIHIWYMLAMDVNSQPLLVPMNIDKFLDTCRFNAWNTWQNRWHNLENHHSWWLSSTISHLILWQSMGLGLGTWWIYSKRKRFQRSLSLMASDCWRHKLYLPTWFLWNLKGCKVICTRRTRHKKIQVSKISYHIK